MAPARKARIEIDQPKLLMSIAEEYFDAAHKVAPLVTASRTTENVDIYQKSIAMGLSCLQAALKSPKLEPRMEAALRLRYAGVLHDETEDSMEAETCLTKGIALCERVCTSIVHVGPSDNLISRTTTATSSTLCIFYLRSCSIREIPRPR